MMSSRWTQLTCFLMIVALVSSCSVVRRSKLTTADLPRSFSGYFHWAREGVCVEPRIVVLTIDEVEETWDGHIVFTGSHVYRLGHHEMRVRGSVNPRSLRVSLQESEPSLPESAVVDGSFEGRFAPDLRSLAAIWTTVGSGDVGALTLRVDSPPQTFKSPGKKDDPPQ